MYGDGSTEEILGELSCESRGIVMETKLYPTAGGGMQKPGVKAYTHSAEDVRQGLFASLEALKCKKVDMFYLHGPDRKTPYETTLREVNKLHQEGLFNRFGLSNYMSWEVAQICEICDKNGWIKPTAYQGIYHALQRSIEAELFPCLRHYGISLYAFQPLAGGFLTGRYTRDQDTFEEGSRFDPKIMQGKLHQGRYWNDSYFDALELIAPVAEKHGLTVAEVALRWLEHVCLFYVLITVFSPLGRRVAKNLLGLGFSLSGAAPYIEGFFPLELPSAFLSLSILTSWQHSLMKKEKNDAIIVGASSVKHLEENLVDLEKGPLSEDVLEVLEKAWLKTKAVAPKYWH